MRRVRYLFVILAVILANFVLCPSSASAGKKAERRQIVAAAIANIKEKGSYNSKSSDSFIDSWWSSSVSSECVGSGRPRFGYSTTTYFGDLRKNSHHVITVYVDLGEVLLLITEERSLNKVFSGNPQGIVSVSRESGQVGSLNLRPHRNYLLYEKVVGGATVSLVLGYEEIRKIFLKVLSCPDLSPIVPR